MLIDSEPIWGSLAQSIKDSLVLKNDEYFDKYKVNNENPLAAFEPKDPKFFGPQVLNILIASTPYGWSGDTFSWPPDGFDESLAKIREAYPQWNEYKLCIYGDRTLAEMADDPDTVNDMLTDTFSQLQTVCGDNLDIGFRWMGEIATLPDPSFFNIVIGDHLDS